MRATRNLKIWYILIDNQEEGPYSAADLRKDRRLSPYTLVRRVGSKTWRPIGKVKELKSVFEDEKKGRGEEQTDKLKPSPGGEVALANPSDPDGPVTLIVFIILLLVVWLVYNLLT
jgi:hypothetical protein